MKKLKVFGFYLIVFIVVFAISSWILPDYMQGQDRKKFIFHPISYYQTTAYVLGAIVALFFVGFGYYKSMHISDKKE